MSTRAQVFFAPGEWITRFILSLFDLNSSDLPPDVFWILSLIATLFFWVQAFKIGIALIKRFTGFDRKVQR